MGYFQKCVLINLLYLFILLTLASPKKAQCQVLPSIEYVKSTAHPLDASIISNDIRVLYFGENHGDKVLKSILVDQLSEFKRKGITHLGIEMLESTDQPHLDRFLSQEISEAEILKKIEQNWGWIPKENLKLLLAARAIGLKIVALDLPYHKFSRLRRDLLLIKRDAYMAEIISKELAKNINSKMLVVIGSDHAKCCASTTQRMLLKKKHISTRAIYVDEQKKRHLEYLVSPETITDYASQVGRVFDESGIEVINPIIVPISIGPYDFYLFHLPSR